MNRVKIPVTAKMRLGTGSDSFNAKEICQDLEHVGVQGYASMVNIETAIFRNCRLEYISKVVDSVEVPVIANGDVVDSSSATACLRKARIDDWPWSNWQTICFW